MTEFSEARRRLLHTSAAWLGGLAAVAAVTRPAGAAMQAVDVSPSSPLGLAVADRCKTAAAEHAGIRSRLTAELAANPALGTLSARCPICGCPVVVSR